MRISLVNVNLVGQDAIGQCILNQWRFFTERGDEVAIYIQHPPTGVAGPVKDDIHVVDVARLIDRNDAHFNTSDLYVYHYPSRYALMDTMPGIERGSVVFYFHNVTPPELWDNARERDLLRHSLESVPYFARYADLIVTPSGYNAAELVTKHGCEADRIRVLPLAVQLQAFAHQPKPMDLARKYDLIDKNVLLFVGRQASNKRLDILIQALSELKARQTHVHLLVVGDHSSNAALRSTHEQLVDLADQLGVRDLIAFTGRVDNLPAYYHLADVYVTASQHEGFGVPLIEAMASDTPVVASDSTAHPWVLGDAGVLVKDDDPRAYADALMDLLNNPQKLGKLVKNGRQRVQDFSLAHYNKGWHEIVSELTAWLPASGYSRVRSIPALDAAADSDAYAQSVRVGDVIRLASLREMAYHMQPLPQTTSTIPVIGKFITWIRRNLTSHLKAQYDPAFGQQRKYNREVAGAFYAVQSLLEQYQSQAQSQIDSEREHVSRLEARMSIFAQEVQLQRIQLTLLQASCQDGISDGKLDNVERELEQLRKSYETLRKSLESSSEFQTWEEK